MATFLPQELSGGANGVNILIDDTATEGKLIHTAVSGTTNWDELDLKIANIDTVARKATLEWSGATIPIEIWVPAEAGFVPLVQGLRLRNGGTVKVFADTINVLIVNGVCNRYTA